MDNIQTINIEDKNYPELLKKISNAPKVLYYRGVLPTNQENCFAIVGTRRPSLYGQQATIEITGQLADANATIVSCMAPCIDTFAHKACVEKGKRTIAVLGTGLDEKSIYPQQNVQLSRDIMSTGGCLISEYPPETPGYPSNFSQRNRIVSGLSLGVLVVEAKEKSGSLITAQYAKVQKKQLFAVPGPIHTLNAKGPNTLIKEGATLVESAQDILSVLGIDSNALAKNDNVATAENSQEQLIFVALQEGSLYIDAIIEKTNLSAPIVGSTLALMEISGKIRHLGGNIYSLN